MRVLVLLLVLSGLLVPTAPAASGTATVPSPGWAAFRLDVPSDWQVKLVIHAQFSGDAVAYGAFVLDAQGRNLIELAGVAPLDGSPEVRARSDAAGIDVRRGDLAILGSVRSTITVSCPGCPAQTLFVVGMAGGDVSTVRFDVDAAGALLAGQGSGGGTLALREDDFPATLDASVSSSFAPGARLSVAEARYTTASRLVGAFFEDEDALPGDLRVTRPDGLTRGCPCVFPRDAAGPGEYAFLLREADVAGSTVLLVSDVTLPP